MAYNAYGVSPSGGRDDKVRFSACYTHIAILLMRRMTTVLPCSHHPTTDQKTLS
jgi:hypothetical protein